MPLFPITRAQRVALKRLYDRCPVYACGRTSGEILHDNGWTFQHMQTVIDGQTVTAWWWEHPDHDSRYKVEGADIVAEHGYAQPMPYRDFRRTAFPSFGAIIVRWCGMTIGIEPDGYTHS